MARLGDTMAPMGHEDGGASAPHPTSGFDEARALRFAARAEAQRRTMHASFLRWLVLLGALLLAVGTLFWMNAPPPEAPLPVPSGPVSGVAGKAAPWKVCDVYGLRIICQNGEGDTMDVTLASQATLDQLCAALPCRFDRPAGNGNLPCSTRTVDGVTIVNDPPAKDGCTGTVTPSG